MRSIFEFTPQERARIDAIGTDYSNLDADDVALLIEWNASAAADKATVDALQSELSVSVRAIAERERAKVGSEDIG